MPYWHCWGHPDWDPCRPKLPPAPDYAGVLPYPEEYDKGIPPVHIGTKRKACGSAGAWAGGPRAQYPPLVYDAATNVCRCCGVPAIIPNVLGLVPQADMGMAGLAQVQGGFPQEAEVGLFPTVSDDPVIVRYPALWLVGDDPFSGAGIIGLVGANEAMPVKVMSLVSSESGSGHSLAVVSDSFPGSQVLELVQSDSPTVEASLSLETSHDLIGGTLGLEGGVVVSGEVIVSPGESSEAVAVMEIQE